MPQEIDSLAKDLIRSSNDLLYVHDNETTTSSLHEHATLSNFSLVSCIFHKVNLVAICPRVESRIHRCMNKGHELLTSGMVFDSVF